MKGGLKIGVGIVAIIGLVIFYGVYGSVNTSAWDATVVALVALLPLAMVISGVLDLFGIKINF